jgi:hypothetical protein
MRRTIIKRPTLVSGLLDPGYLTPPTWSHARPIPRHSPPAAPPLQNYQRFAISCFRCHVGFTGPHERLSACLPEQKTLCNTERRQCYML